MEDNILYLTRFCGEEQYPVERAIWYIIAGDGTEDDPDMLCLEMQFGVGSNLHEDTSRLKAKPAWEVNFYSLQIPVSSLCPGFCLEQPNKREDIAGNLYYADHQPTTDNKMEIVAADGERLKIKLTGITEDVNYYDGSKPKNTLQLVAWFDKK